MATVKKTEEKSVFETLSAINVNSKVEKKNNLTYLSWAWAWAEVVKVYPEATYEVSKYGEPGKEVPYIYDDNLGYMCDTTVTIEGKTLEMWLPVMDGANKSMKANPYTFTTRYGDKEVAGATMFDINKTIMRCLVKNLAMFGMAIYIYAGEDMPTSEEPTPIKKEAPQKSSKLPLAITDKTWVGVAKFCTDNKSLGFKKLTDKIGTKYELSSVVQNEIKKLLK